MQIISSLWKSGHRILADYFKLLILSADQKMLSYPADTKIVSLHLCIKEKTILNNDKAFQIKSFGTKV